MVVVRWSQGAQIWMKERKASDGEIASRNKRQRESKRKARTHHYLIIHFRSQVPAKQPEVICVVYVCV